MRRPTRVAVSIPQTFETDQIDIGAIKRFVQRAEELGFDSLWVQESISGPARQLDAIELLTFAAAHTQRVRLGPAVLLTALRPPLPTAKTLLTLDHLSGGRLTVAVGLGRLLPVTAGFGVGPHDRLAHFLEAFHILKALWTQDSVTYAGTFWHLEQVQMEPKPVQKPHPPLWWGVHHPAGLRRAARYADGFIGAGAEPNSQFAAEVVELRRLLEQGGRDPEPFPFAKRAYIAVDADAERAKRRLTEHLGGYGNDMAERVGIWGSAERCTEGLLEIVKAGAELVLLTPLFDQAEQLEIFAADIKPHLEAYRA